MTYELLHFPADHQIPWQWWRIPENENERSAAERSAKTDDTDRWERMRDGTLGLYLAGFSNEQDARAYGHKKGWK